MSAKPRLLIVEDDEPLRRLLARTLGSEDRELSQAADAKEAFASLKNNDPDVVLLDLGLPDASGLDVLKAALESRRDRAVIILTGQAGEASVVEAMRVGAHDYLTKDTPLEGVEAKVASAFMAVAKEGNAREGGIAADMEKKGNLVGRSAGMIEVFKQVGTLAPSSVPVLIVGESGTGKEKVARALHTWGANPKGPFVVVDCASLPANLLESELFGYEKGAFTGATGSKKGRFEEADGGTLFLDEIGNISMEVAAKLLRALQEKTTQRLGSNRPVPFNARIVSATNADLWGMAKKGEFREDVVYRLAGAEIRLPPLRDRPEDVEQLARHFLGLIEDAGENTVISAEALALMKAYPWPGNVRELEHAVRRAVAVARGQAVLPEHLPDALREASPLARAGVKPARSEEDLATLDEIRRQYARYAVEICRGNRSEAAKRLGVDRRTLNTLLGEKDGPDK